MYCACKFACSVLVFSIPFPNNEHGNFILQIM